MDTLWFPSDEEILEILGSNTIKKDFEERRATQINRTEQGVKTRLAYLTSGGFEVESVVIYCAATQVDLDRLVSSHTE